MKKLVLIVLVLFAVPSSVLAWGSATHSCLVQNLGSDYRIMDLQEIYGSVLPDLPNLMFGSPYQGYLWNQTHYEFMDLVDISGFGRRKALAFGFATHNEAWGADYTAHISAVNNPAEGYVITKRNILAPLLEPLLIANGIPPVLAGRIADVSVESAVDLLVSQNECQNIGSQMRIAAKYRSYFVPFLLSRAYAEDLANQAGISRFQASWAIFQAEAEFKKYIQLYGSILNQADPVDAMAEQGALLAEEILNKEYGIILDVPPQLMKDSFLAAVEVVENDYSQELADTLDYVENQLELHGIESY